MITRLNFCYHLLFQLPERVLKLDSLVAAFLTVFFLRETVHVMGIATEDRTAVMTFRLPASKV